MAGPFVVPRLLYKCSHLPNTGDGFLNSSYSDGDSCSYDVRTPDGDFRQEPCTQWDFDNSTFTNTITSEFGLVCQKEYVRALYMSLYMIGVLVASPSIGYLADRFGRKRTFVSGVLAFNFLSIISSWLPNIPSLLVCRFLIGITHVPVVKISYILGVESISPEVRSVGGLLLYILWTLYTIAFGSLAYFVRDWRWLLTTASLSSLVILPSLWFLDESPHWLVVRGHYGHALQVLKKAARWNNVTLPPDDEIICLFKENTAVVSRPREIEEEKQSWKDTLVNNGKELFILFRTPRLRIVSSVMHLNFFVSGMVYYGLAFSGGNFKIDIFSYMILLGLTELPSHTVMIPIVAHFGRKIPYILGFFLSGIILLCITFIPYEMSWLVVTFALLGRLNICVASAISYLYGSELFPTEVRTRGITYSFMFSRAGSSIAPFITEYLGYAYQWAPTVVFGGAAIIASVASMALWETLGTPLPDTIEHLESADTKSTVNVIFWKKRSVQKPTEREARDALTEEKIQLKETS